jgi:23S rRNA (uridine2552-2'-O)-methyltransferase
MVIGIDIEHMNPVEGAYILHQSDFTLPETQEKVFKILNGRPVDVVLSDMAPKATGQKSLDHDRIVELCFTVLLFGKKVLKPGGSLVCKLWQGANQHRLEAAMTSLFEKVKVAKPSSSRSDSAEIFLVGKNFQSRPENVE